MEILVVILLLGFLAYLRKRVEWRKILFSL